MKIHKKDSLLDMYIIFLSDFSISTSSEEEESFCFVSCEIITMSSSSSATKL